MYPALTSQAFQHIGGYSPGYGVVKPLINRAAAKKIASTIEETGNPKAPVTITVDVNGKKKNVTLTPHTQQIEGLEFLDIFKNTQKPMSETEKIQHYQDLYAKDLGTETVDALLSADGHAFVAAQEQAWADRNTHTIFKLDGHALGALGQDATLYQGTNANQPAIYGEGSYPDLHDKYASIKRDLQQTIEVFELFLNQVSHYGRDHLSQISSPSSQGYFGQDMAAQGSLTPQDRQDILSDWSKLATALHEQIHQIEALAPGAMDQVQGAVATIQTIGLSAQDLDPSDRNLQKVVRDVMQEASHLKPVLQEVLGDLPNIFSDQMAQKLKDQYGDRLTIEKFAPGEGPTRIALSAMISDDFTIDDFIDETTWTTERQAQNVGVSDIADFIAEVEDALLASDIVALIR